MRLSQKILQHQLQRIPVYSVKNMKERKLKGLHNVNLTWSINFKVHANYSSVQDEDLTPNCSINRDERTWLLMHAMLMYMNITECCIRASHQGNHITSFTECVKRIRVSAAAGGPAQHLRLPPPTLQSHCAAGSDTHQTPATPDSHSWTMIKFYTLLPTVTITYYYLDVCFNFSVLFMP